MLEIDGGSVAEWMAKVETRILWTRENVNTVVRNKSPSLLIIVRLNNSAPLTYLISIPYFNIL